MAKIDFNQQKRATPEQQKFIEILSGDLGFNRPARNKNVSMIVNRSIHYLDELSVPEASTVIDKFKSWKEH